MKKSISILLFTMAISQPTFADDNTEKQQRNDMIGLGSGVVIGSIVAGPIGGAVAGIMGLLIAEDINNDNKVEDMSGKLANLNSKLSQRDNQLLAMQDKYQQLERQSQLQMVSMDREIERVVPDLSSTVQFRSGSYLLESHYQPQLDKVASSLVKNAKMQISLAGYADRHGDEDLNRALSEQRLLSVKNYLVSKGVKEQQIVTQAFGEENPVSAQQNYQDDFFDRRVVLHLKPASPVMTAAK